MADRKETIVFETEIDVDESVESINKLTAANKELRKERNALNIATEAGKKRAQEINAVIDSNTNKIKENVSAIEKQKINIGNYKSALDGVHPALGQVAVGLEKGEKGFKAMTLQALRFIATPIGAVLAAIVAVFGLLKSALSQNDALMDKFENVTSAVSVVLDVVVSRVGKLGEALIALAQGNFNEAINLTSEAFSGLSQEIGNAVRQQQLFIDASRELEDATISLSIKTAKYENEIKRLVVAAKNRSLTFDQQKELLKRSLELEEELIAEKTDIARRDLVIEARRLRVAKEFQQQENENFDQYIKRLLESDKIGYEEKKKIADKLNALEAARGASLPFQEKVANTLASIEDKRADALRKQNEELAKQIELQKKSADQQEKDVLQAQINLLQQQIQVEKELQQLRIDARPEGLSKELAQLDFDIQERISKIKGSEAQITEQTLLLEEQRNRSVIEIREKYRQIDLQKQKENDEKRTENAKKQAAIEEDVERSKVQIISQLTGSLANLAEQDSIAHKALASAQALINTYLAATAALASGSEINPVFGIIAAATAVANGLANVARINGVEFADGGYTGPGHKYKPAGIVHAGEVVWNQEDVKSVGGPAVANAMRPTAKRMRPSYGRYADGGVVTSNISQPINQQMELLNIVKNLPPQELSVKEVTTVQKRIRVKEQISKR